MEPRPDEDIFPIVFCYRQYWELLLKHLYQAALDDDAIYVTELRHIGHDLNRLWEKAKPYVKQYLKGLDFEKSFEKSVCLFYGNYR